VSLATPEKLRKLQRALYATAKRDPVRRFHVLYDKVWREDILAHAFALSRENGGAPGVDGVTFAQIETYGVARWLGELREEVRTGRYTPQPVRRVMIPKSGGVGQRPLGIPTITAYCGAVQYAFRVPHRDAPVPPVGGAAAADPFHTSSSDRSHLYL
jgi:RNA-directed DNA polymerase